MAAIILPHRWRQQPQVPVGIDWGNPLTRGLVDAIIPAQMRSARGVICTPGGGIVTVAGAQSAVAVGATSPSRGAGMARSHGNLTTRDTYGAIGAGLPLPLTHLGFYTHTSFSGNRYAGNYSVGASGFGFLSNASHRVLLAGAGGNSILTGQTFSLGTPYVVAHVANASTHALWVDGQVQASGAVASYAAPAGSYGIGADGIGGSSCAIDAFLFALWARELTTGELGLLSENPWQIFRPLTRRVWVPSVGGTDHTISVSGGIDLSGATSSIRARSLDISGGISLLGTSTNTFSKILPSSGLMVLSGTGSITTSGGSGSTTTTQLTLTSAGRT